MNHSLISLRLLIQCFGAIGNAVRSDGDGSGCVARNCKEKTGRDGISQSFLHCHPKQWCNECHLISHLSFFHALYLSFSYHVHDLISLSCSPSCLEREKAHPRFCQTFDEAMVLFNEIVEVFHLSQFTACGKMFFCLKRVECFGVGGVFVHVDDTRSHGMSGGKGCKKEVLCCFSISR